MMGRQVGEAQLFYIFSVDRHVPADHLLRRVDAVLDLSFIRSSLAEYYSHTGRPSVDPELMIRMLLVGYLYGIRSETRLCEEVHLHLKLTRLRLRGLAGASEEFLLAATAQNLRKLVKLAVAKPTLAPSTA